MEVVAKKAMNALVVYVGLMCIGLIICGLMAGMTFPIVAEELALLSMNIPLFLAGAALFVYAAIIVDKIRKMPNDVICRQGDELFFAGKSCLIGDVTGVTVRRGTWGDKSATMMTRAGVWGTVTVFIGDREEKFRFIIDIFEVQRILLALVAESKKENPNYGSVN